MTNNVVIQFLSEIIIRLRKKSPLFFRILQYISIAVAIIPGIPSLLESFGVVLSPVFASLANQTVAICGIVAAFLTGLPVDKESLPIDPHDLPPVNDTFELKMSVAPTETVVQRAIKLPFTDNNK